MNEVLVGCIRGLPSFDMVSYNDFDSETGSNADEESALDRMKSTNFLPSILPGIIPGFLKGGEKEVKKTGVRRRPSMIAKQLAGALQTEQRNTINLGSQQIQQLNLLQLQYKDNNDDDDDDDTSTSSDDTSNND